MGVQIPLPLPSCPLMGGHGANTGPVCDEAKRACVTTLRRPAEGNFVTRAGVPALRKLCTGCDKKRLLKFFSKKVRVPV